MMRLGSSAQRTRITVVSWEMGHNAVGRPYFLADMLRRRCDVTLVGPNFPLYGTELWDPIRNTDLRIRRFPGADLPEYVAAAERAIRGIPTDLVIVCKPRFPGLVIAMLLKAAHGVPVIADLDEWELSWTDATDALSLDGLERLRGQRGLELAFGTLWSRAAEPLIADADAVTVASPVLQEIYGGTIVAQARDELVFDPSRYDRDEVRAEYGYTPDDRVVLFLGSPKRFKGILELAQALEQLGDPRNKLCVIGTITDPVDRIELARIAAGRTQLVEYRPASEVPRLTLIGDLVCLFQDPGHRTTRHQLPAKLTEILAMGVPVLARETPPLEPFVREGLISGIGDSSVAARISELLSNPDEMRAQAERGRRYFAEQLSYAATLEVLDRVFAGLEGSPHELPPNWGRALQLARTVPDFSGLSKAANDPALPRRCSTAPSRECPFCGLVCAGFEPVGEAGSAGARCPSCGSLERHRLAWLYLLNETDLFSGPERRRMLHLDPEVPSWQRLERSPTVAFVSPDLGSEPPGLDLTELPFPDESFDVVCCGRALARAADRDHAARGLARVLRPGGWALVHGGGAGADPLARAGLQVTVDPYPRRISQACAERFGLTLEDEIHLARKGTGDGHVARRWAGAHDLPRPTPVPGAVPVFSGRVEEVRDGIVSGWVWRPAAPEHRVRVRVIVDGAGVTDGVAERERLSLADAGIGDGRYVFRVSLPATVARPGNRLLMVEPEGSVALAPAAGFSARVEEEPDPSRGAAFAVDGFVVGRVERVRGGVVCGWVWSPESTGAPAEVRVLLDGHDAGSCLAEVPRESLADAPSGDGRRGFRLRLPGELAGPGRHSVRVLVGGVPLPPTATFATVAGSDGAACGGVEIVGNGFARGRVEEVREGVVSGWAWDPATPGWRVGVRALVDGLDITGAVAHRYRPPLADFGVGDGAHGFLIKLPASVARSGHHRLRIEAGGTRLPPATSFRAVPAEPSSVWEGVEFALEDPVLGRVERVCDGVVSGWACRPDKPGWRVRVRVIVDGAEVGRGRADLDRPELAETGLGDGRYGFRVALPAELAGGSHHSLRVEATGGVPLGASASFVTMVARRWDLWAGVEFHVQDAVIGRVEHAADGIVSGWAWRPGAPAWRVWVRLVVDGTEACSSVADVDRPSLRAEGIGDGRHGFHFRLPAALPETGHHRVLVEAEGIALPVAAGFGDGATRGETAWGGAEFCVDSAESTRDLAGELNRVPL